MGLSYRTGAMDIQDILNMRSPQLLNAFEELVKKDNLDPNNIDSDCVLYQQMKIEIESRMGWGEDYLYSR